MIFRKRDEFQKLYSSIEVIMPTSILYLPLKVPIRNDLVVPIGNWLDNYESQVSHATHPNSISGAPALSIKKCTYSSLECRSELQRIAALRNCMAEHLQDAHKSALEDEMLRDCQDYHATLLVFETRGAGPSVGDDIDNGIALTWKGAFETKEQETHHTLLWDRACTLWNTASLKSASAAFHCDQTTKEGLKKAIGFCQQAASHLLLCKQLMESLNEFVSTVDLSKPMLKFWEKIMLAQAQTLIYQMANLGGSVRNHTTLAYLIQGASPLYNEALIITQDPRLQSEVPNPCQEWAAHCKAQSLLCQSRASFHMSIQSRLSNDHGIEIARLRQTICRLEDVLSFCASSQVLQEANKIFNNTTMSPMAEAAATIQPDAENLKRLASDRLKAVELDNQNIYLEEIPRNDQLGEIRPQTMVKRDLPLPNEMLTPRVNLFGWD